MITEKNKTGKVELSLHNYHFLHNEVKRARQREADLEKLLKENNKVYSRSYGGSYFTEEETGVQFIKKERYDKLIKEHEELQKKHIENWNIYLLFSLSYFIGVLVGYLLFGN